MLIGKEYITIKNIDKEFIYELASSYDILNSGVILSLEQISQSQFDGRNIYVFYNYLLSKYIIVKVDDFYEFFEDLRKLKIKKIWE